MLGEHVRLDPTAATSPDSPHFACCRADFG